MTNRTTIRPYSAGVTIKSIKKPRLRRFDLTFDAAPPPTPEGINNGMRPHGGYRGMRALPPGQFTFNKGQEYQQDLDEEYRILVNNENYEMHGAPYWLNEVQREITNNGESPLFTNNLLSSGKFEQEQGEVNYERTVLNNTIHTRRPIVPRRRHLNGRKEYYRPNSTHQYLSATDLRNLHDNEETMLRYGRPTRTTLLRARQRTNSAPVNAYDVRRENNKRTEDVKNNTIFHTSKEYFNIYASDGETMHSFLTGARYNRAHLVDSKGLAVYGIYMPRGNPSDCFITGPRRHKDVGDEIPSAPPDSPRSDCDESLSPYNMSRPTSSRHLSLPPSSRSSYARPTTKQSQSRPQSYKKPSLRQSSSGSRPRSAKDQIHQATANISHTMPPKNPDKKDFPLPEEVTMAMPDHINKGKQGVYVTLKGQKIIESVDSKLPRVTGISLPKIRKSRDFVEEMLYVNQPPPTPVDASVVTIDKNKHDMSNTEGRSIHQIEEQPVEEEIPNGVILNEVNDSSPEKVETENKADEVENKDDIETIEGNSELPISKVLGVDNVITDKKSTEIGPIKKVNFEDESGDNKVKEHGFIEEHSAVMDDPKKEDDIVVDSNASANNVLFFITEDDDTYKQTTKGAAHSKSGNDITRGGTVVNSKVVEELEELNEVNRVAHENSTDNLYGTEDGERTIQDVIKVEISEQEKKPEEHIHEEENSGDEKPLTSKDYPFGQSDNPHE